MISKVYFTQVKDSNDNADVIGRLKTLLEKSRILDVVGNNDKVAVKAHFGEEGNTGYVRPEYVSVVCQSISARGGVPVIADTNTLYHGKRSNSKDHLECARKHGFTKESVGADIVIPDDADKKNTRLVNVNAKLIKSAKVSGLFLDADAIIAVNHFKGHVLAGFGGALKNIGMGCATREGKLAQHCDVAPVVHKDECIGCKACMNICPAKAIQMEDARAVVDKALCVGCADCILVCPTNAMFIDFKAGRAVQEKMAEYASAVIKNKKRMAYINFAVRILKECDCWGMETPQIAPDVGIFASLDPVAIDKASYDMVLKACGKDPFKEVHPDQDGTIQLKYAAELGLGNLDYELIEIK
jgi:hypothetical protein